MIGFCKMKKLALATLALVTAFGATQAMANDKVVKMKKKRLG